MSNQAPVPYEQHTPEQREEFVGRIKILNVVNINTHLLLDNWRFIESACPSKQGNQRAYNDFKNIVKDLKEAVHYNKRLSVRINNFLCAGDKGKENVESYSWYNKEIISKILLIPQDRIELAIKVLDGIAGEENIQAESPEEYANKMIKFGQYCMELQKSGRKKVTTKDLEKFLNTK